MAQAQQSTLTIGMETDNAKPTIGGHALKNQQTKTGKNGKDQLLKHANWGGMANWQYPCKNGQKNLETVMASF